MSSSVTADSVLSLKALGVNQDVFWDIAIFAVALIISLAVRNTSGKKKLCKAERSLNSSPVLACHGSVAGCDHAKQPKSRGDGGSLSKGPSSISKQTANVIDEVVSLGDGHPSLQSLKKALTLYKNLRTDCKRQDIAQAWTYSKHPAVKFYGVLIKAAVRVGFVEMIDSIFDDMSQQDVCSLDLYEDAMKLLASQKRFRLALNVYDRLAATGLVPSDVTWSCLVGFATEVGEFQRAVSFFEKLSSISTPSIRAYMTILRVYGKLSDWPASLAVFHDMQKKGVTIDSPVLNLVLATGIAVDQIEGAEKLLAEAESMNIPDTVSYNTLVKGYAQRNDARKACQTFCRMKERGLPCTTITFNTVIDAAIRACKTKVAMELLSSMHESGLRPDKFTCTSLIKGLSKDPSLSLLESCLDILCDSKFECDKALRSRLYQSLLDNDMFRAALAGNANVHVVQKSLALAEDALKHGAKVSAECLQAIEVARRLQSGASKADQRLQKLSTVRAKLSIECKSAMS